MAIINSRPLTAHLLNNPAVPKPLTPNHILMMKPSIEFVEEDLHIRKRWHDVQYLANVLDKKAKWLPVDSPDTEIAQDAQINDIMIVQDNSAPWNKWKLAKVTEVFPSEDGCVVKLKLLNSDSALDDQARRLTKPLYLERPMVRPRSPCLKLRSAALLSCYLCLHQGSYCATLAESYIWVKRKEKRQRK